MKRKLTLVSVNGKAAFVMMPADEDGRVRTTWERLAKVFPFIRRGVCVGLR